MSDITSAQSKRLLISSRKETNREMLSEVLDGRGSTEIDKGCYSGQRSLDDNLYEMHPISLQGMEYERMITMPIHTP